MRRLSLLLLATLCSAVAMAQSVIVVDSEKIFKSQSDYSAALTQVDTLIKGYEAEVEAKYAEVEKMFNEYAAVQSRYTESMRQQVEAAILYREQEANSLESSYFDSDGLAMKKRIEIIEPIQKRVFGAIESYAKSKGADVVLDRAANPSILYIKDGVDCTDKIIEQLNR